MKTTFVLDIQKDKYEYTSLIVTGRMGDLESNTVDVYIKNGGEPCPLTNLTVFYECVKPDDTAIRDKEGVNIIDAAKGHFTYTFPAEVFSAPGQVKRSFFSIEKGKTFRATTQDFLVISLRDALTGNIESETYISEFDKALEMVKGHRKEIDEANKKIAELTPYIQKKVDETDTKFKGVIGQIQLRVDGVSKQIDAMDIVKKAGDTINGLLEYKSDNAFVLGSRSYKTIFHKGAQGELIFAPSTKEQGDTWDWSKKVEIRTDGTIKQATDTNWTNLKTTGVENVPDRPLKYKKTGGLVTVMGSIRNPKNVVNFATLPEGFRPPQDVAFSVVIISGSTTAGEFTIQKGGGLFVSGAPANATCHLVASYVV
ncbi:BppU family phage baseplate upper protein [Bacillus albus]|uniref:BppU family phage baseplate upper protein n=1 Tax=Bacillus albus TaxID=2026189 RepID=UPI00101F49E0|nr:BppU family phage baseplate upper protein [Bacillus albus]